jgi:hypothetical protein
LGVSAKMLVMSLLGRGSLMRKEQAPTLRAAKKPTATVARRQSHARTEKMTTKALKKRNLK